MNVERTNRPSTDRRADVLNLLRERDAPVEIAEIAEALGVHPNTVRFHLESLVANGQVERTVADPVRTGRPPLLFAAVRAMDRTGPRNYRLLAEILANDLTSGPKSKQRAMEAGRRWGLHQAAEMGTPQDGAQADQKTVAVIDGLVRVLDELDFSPELIHGDEGPYIGLRHCPFLDLAGSRPDVVCPVHLGLMRGVLESWETDITVERLDTFVQPDLCTAHLGIGVVS